MSKQAVIGGLILWLVSGGSAVFAQTDPSAKYFPLADGNSWTYLVTGTEGTYNETMTVAPGPNMSGVATKAIQYSDGSRDYYTSDTNGIMYHGFYVSNPSPEVDEWGSFDPPIVYADSIMHIPDTINSSGILWYEEHGYYQFSYTNVSMIEAVETVQVPAGTYEAVRLAESTNIVLDIGINYTSWGDTWLAKHIGIVKQTFFDNAGTAEEWVLTSTNVEPPAGEEPVRFLPFLPLLLEAEE